MQPANQPFRIKGSWFYSFINILVLVSLLIIGLPVIIGSKTPAGAVGVTVLLGLLAFLFLHDAVIAYDVEVDGTQLTTRNMLIKKSVDLTILKYAAFKFAFGGKWGLGSGMYLLLKDQDGHTVRIGSGGNKGEDLAELWARISGYVLRDSVRKSSSFDKYLNAKKGFGFFK